MHYYRLKLIYFIVKSSERNLKMAQNNMRYYQDNTQEETRLSESTQPEIIPQTTPGVKMQQEIPPESIDENRESLVFSRDGEEFDAEDGDGTISVQVSTARGASPVSEATVIIYKVRDGKNNIVSFNLTDESGRTPTVTVSAPKKANSQTPSSSLPFADYNITVRHPMYYTAIIDNVQVFGDELTIQSVDLIPLPEFVNERNTEITTKIPKQNL